MIIQGNALTVLQGMNSESVHCCVTSPPYYGLRDYGLPPTMWSAVDYSPLPGMQEIHIAEWEGCLGLEPTVEMFLGHIVLIFREVRRILRNDGTLWMNFGDSYCSTAPGTMGDNIHIEGTKEATKRARKIMRPELSSGMKPKDLQGIPWRAAFALQADGWYLRSDIIWHKPNPMPESVQDRPTKAHEYIFLLSKSQKYYYDAHAIKEPIVCPESSTLEDIQRAMNRKRFTDPTEPSYRAPSGWDTEKGSHGAFHKDGRRPKGNAKTFRGGGTYTQGRSYDNDSKVERESHGNTVNESGMKNKRDVWTVATQPFPEAHFATFPTELIRPCILAGCPVGGIALDPFHGSGTTGQVSLEENRDFIGIDLNPDYIEIQKKRISNVQVKMII